MWKTVDFFTALRQKLLSHALLRQTLSGIFIQASSDTDYPYITLEWSETTTVLNRTRLLFTIKIWSLHPGIQEIEALGNAVQETLQRPEGLTFAPLIGHIYLRDAQTDLQRDSQGTRCLSLTYQAFIKKPVEAFDDRAA